MIASRPLGRLVIAAALIVSGCATAAPAPRSQRDPVGAALEQPFRDLSLVRDELPELLRRAAAEPYRNPANCEVLGQELAKLDQILGPDVDQEAVSQDGAAVAGDLLADLAELPFRGVVRRLSGARSHDELVAAAVLAGMVRRGFLRGAAAGLQCASLP